jgi:hypothetical protein
MTDPSPPDDQVPVAGDQPPPAAPGDQPPAAAAPIPIGNQGLFDPRSFRRHRSKTTIGMGITAAVLLSLLATIVLAGYLAIEHRQSSYIDAVLKSLSPFILPTLGAVVGYAFGEQSRSTED